MVVDVYICGYVIFGDRISNKIFLLEQEMYVIGILKEGLGNKLFMLVAYINKFRNIHKENKDVNMLYIVQAASKHEEGLKCEQFTHIFPSLKTVDWLKFITWKEYDTLKKDAFQEFPVDFLFSKDDFIELKPFIKKHLKMNPIYEKLLDKYDTKKGIAVHVRLGDKFNINYNRLNTGRPESFLLMSPRYYIEEVQKLLDEKKGPVYIFSDSVEFSKCLLLPEMPDAIIAKEKAEETFFLFTKFKRAVLSESTFGLAAGYMHGLKHQFVIPSYRLKLMKGIITESKYVDPEYFQLEDDTSYKLKPSEYKDIYKKCYA